MSQPVLCYKCWPLEFIFSRFGNVDILIVQEKHVRDTSEKGLRDWEILLSVGFCTQISHCVTSDWSYMHLKHVRSPKGTSDSSLCAPLWNICFKTHIVFVSYVPLCLTSYLLTRNKSLLYQHDPQACCIPWKALLEAISRGSLCASDDGVETEALIFSSLINQKLRNIHKFRDSCCKTALLVIGSQQTEVPLSQSMI